MQSFCLMRLLWGDILPSLCFALLSCFTMHANNEVAQDVSYRYNSKFVHKAPRNYALALPTVGALAMCPAAIQTSSNFPYSAVVLPVHISSRTLCRSRTHVVLLPHMIIPMIPASEPLKPATITVIKFTVDKTIIARMHGRVVLRKV